MSKFETGQAALITVIFVLALLVVIAVSLNTLSVRRHVSQRHLVDSVQSYYLAEAGLEDSLLRVIDPNLPHQANTTLTLNGSTATISISQVGPNFVITSAGNVKNQIRHLSTQVHWNSIGANFMYGVQIGEGGLEIRHSQGKIDGNVYANGTSFGGGSITGSITVAGANNQLQDLTIGQDGAAYACDRAKISRNLTYHTSGFNTCQVSGTTTANSKIIAPLDFPISQSKLDEWKATAAAGGPPINGNVNITSNTTLGPVKINGDLNVSNNITLTLNGVVWVTGKFSNGNNAIVKLSSDFGTLSGPLIFDGTVKVANNGNLTGSGDPNSFMLLITTSNSNNETTPAIDILNNLTGVIMYAPNGLVTIRNGVALQEVTANQVLLFKATVTYNTGLANLNFSSGPSGGWTFTSWREID